MSDGTSRSRCADAPYPEPSVDGGGMGAVLSGTVEAARQAFEQAIQLDPTNFRAYYGLGRYFLRLGNWSEAERAFQKCLELNRRSTLGEEGLMLLARRRRHWLRAIQLFFRITVKAWRYTNETHL